MKKNKTELDFTAALQELEQISQWFQQEQINLDEGLKKVARGKELIALCRGTLQQVENEFVQITENTETNETVPPKTKTKKTVIKVKEIEEEPSELDELLAQTSAEIKASPEPSVKSVDLNAPDPDDDIPF